MSAKKRFDRAERQMSEFDRINGSRRARERHDGLVRTGMISVHRSVSYGVTTKLVKVAAESTPKEPHG